MDAVAKVCRQDAGEGRSEALAPHVARLAAAASGGQPFTGING
jgi:hypothetical protein